MAETNENSNDLDDRNASPGDPSEEFIVSFTRVQRPLFLYLLPLLGNAADADEVLQETNLVIWKKRTDFQPGTSFLAWGRTIARLEVFRFRRNRGRKLSFLDQAILESIAATAESIGNETEVRQEALARCMEQLRPKDRELIQMRYASDSNGDKVAQQLGRPPNSVYQSLGRIRRALMECVQHRIAEHRLKEEGGLS
jgi:RNA polymerase sigma-70 factor, ECF subfamily